MCFKTVFTSKILFWQRLVQVHSFHSGFLIQNLSTEGAFAYILCGNGEGIQKAKSSKRAHVTQIANLLICLMMMTTRRANLMTCMYIVHGSRSRNRSINRDGFDQFRGR